MNRLIAALLLTLAPLHAADDLAQWNGVYSLCSELGKKSTETIELKDGRFRYWSWSSKPAKEKLPRYPLSGWFAVQGTTLTLESQQIDENVRNFSTLNGVPVLWNERGLRAWKDDMLLVNDAVLIRCGDTPDNPRDPAPPPASIKTIQTPEFLALEAKRFAARYDKVPEPARTLLITSSELGDPARKDYRAAIQRLRADIHPDTFKQLLSRLKYENPDNLRIHTMLEDLIPSDSDSTALHLLVDALPELPDRSNISTVMTLFLARAGIETITLDIPEGGVRVRLVKKLRRTACELRTLPLNPPEDAFLWTDRIAVITAGCQKWCRDQLATPRRFRAKEQ